jgi:hypothetical protein
MGVTIRVMWRELGEGRDGEAELAEEADGEEVRVDGGGRSVRHSTEVVASSRLGGIDKDGAVGKVVVAVSVDGEGEPVVVVHRADEGLLEAAEEGGWKAEEGADGLVGVRVSRREARRVEGGEGAAH